MKILRLAVIAAVALSAMLVAVPASAAQPLITFRVEGTVDLIEGVTPVGFDIGDAFSITYRFDSTAPDTWAPVGYAIYDAVTSVSAEIGSYVVTGAGGTIYLTNDIVSGTGQIKEVYAASFLPVAGDALGSAEPFLLSLNIQNNDSDGSVFADESLPAAVLDLTSFPTRFLALEFEDPACSGPGPCPPLVVTASVDSMTLVIDGDADGVADNIGTGIAGAFDDGNGTSGIIINNGGLDVLVEEAGPGGVRITATGGGGPAVVQICGFTLNLSAGSDATIKCGSVTVDVDAGETIVVLGGTDKVTISPGGSATIDQLGDGTYVVNNFGSTPIAVTLGGTTTTVAPGTTVVIPPDADGDGVTDDVDACLGTVLPDVAPEQKPNRYFVDGDGVFRSEARNAPQYTIAQTSGCSASQIIEIEDLGVGHVKFGLSRSALEEFIAA